MARRGALAAAVLFLLAAQTASAQDAADLAIARPIFHQSRRQQAGPITPASRREPPPRLSGVVVNGGERTAMLVPPGASTSIALHEGMRIGTFDVERIGAGWVTLTGPGGSVVLRPSSGSALQAPPTIRPPTPVPPSINED